MPSRYSSLGSVTDAEKLAANLGIELQIASIEEAHQAFAGMFAPVLEEIRPVSPTRTFSRAYSGVILMAISNARPGWIVLTTGNKSELAVGLLDALRGLCRRVRRHPGRAEDSRVPALPAIATHWPGTT